jgi:chromosomal replication initiation ATPase DnaA
MSNVLSDDKRQQILALGRLGWSLRRIEQTTGLRRETASAFVVTGYWNDVANRLAFATQRTLDNFDFNFNKKMNRSLVFELAAANFISRREDALFLGPPGSGKSHLAHAIGQAVIQQGYRVLYRETHSLLDELAEATIDGSRTRVHGLVSRLAPADN